MAGETFQVDDGYYQNAHGHCIIDLWNYLVALVCKTAGGACQVTVGYQCLESCFAHDV